RPRQFMTALKARTASRFCQLTIVASRLAVEDADLADAALASSRAGLFLGTSEGPAQVAEDQGALFREHGPGGGHGTFPFTLSPPPPPAMPPSEFATVGPIAPLSPDCPPALAAQAPGGPRARGARPPARWWAARTLPSPRSSSRGSPAPVSSPTTTTGRAVRRGLSTAAVPASCWAKPERCSSSRNGRTRSAEGLAYTAICSA